MKGYCLFDNVHVSDFSKLEEYKQKTAPIVARYGGRYVILGGQFKVIEGDWTPTYLVMIEFPSYEKANDWYQSEDYGELKALRQSAVNSHGIIIEGLN